MIDPPTDCAHPTHLDMQVWFDTMYPGQTNACTGSSTTCVELWQLSQYSVDNLCPYTTPTAQSGFSVFAYT